MNREKMTNLLIAAGVLAPLFMLAACIAIAFGIVKDNTLLQNIGTVLAIVSLASIVAGMIAAFMSKKIIIGLGGLLGIAICLSIGFYTAIAIGAGQHHPPRQGVKAEEVVADLENYAEALDNQLKKDSWWTNGHRYFRMTKTGATYSLEGMTLHEGGMEALLETRGDSATLWVAKPRSGMSSFASIGSKVEHYRYLLSNADSTAIELLIAYDKDDEETPVDALQRYDGDELKFELAGIHALLEGTFTDGKTEWTLLPDGTVKLAKNERAKPYTVELFYHMPTNVVKLPDGRHVALQLNDDDELLVLAAAYDDDEEQWDEAQPRKVLLRLPRKEQTSRRDMYVLEEERLVTPAMLTFMDGDIDEVVRRYNSIDFNGRPIGVLNKALLRHWQYVQNNDIEEEM